MPNDVVSKAMWQTISTVYVYLLILAPVMGDETPDNVTESIYTRRRLMGGEILKDIRKYPFMAFLMATEINSLVGLNDSSYKVVISSCGASILSQRYVLTAAHCFKKCHCSKRMDDSVCGNCTTKDPRNYFIYAGNYIPMNATAISSIKKLYLHPQYKHTDTSYRCKNRFDVAVLELEKPLEFRDTISPVTLPTAVYVDHEELSITNALIKERKKCIILGWGRVSKYHNAPRLQRKLKIAKVPLIQMNRCKHLIKKATKMDLCLDTSICSLSKRNAACNGDSGGPMMCGGIQVGLSSWGVNGCLGPRWPNVYTRIDIAVPWIMEVMSYNNESTNSF